MDLNNAKIKLIQKVPDFAKKIQPLYQLLGWTWGGVKSFVPKAKEIEEALYRLISDIDEKSLFTRTGGLTVYIKDKDELGMEFTVSEVIFLED